MESKKLKIIFFGLGSAGQRHIRNVLKLKKNLSLFAFKSTKLDFLITNNLEALSKKKVTTKYKIKVLNSIKKIKKISPDVAFICNSSNQHLKYAIICAKLGCDIFIEKPISDKKKNIRTFMKIIKKKKLVLSVGYQFLFHPLLHRIKKIIINKTFGELSSGRLIMSEYVKKYRKFGTYKDLLITKNSKGGGILREQSHDLNYLIWLVGVEPKIVNVIRYKHQFLNFENGAEDSVNLNLLFKKKRKNIFFNLMLLSAEKEKEKKIILTFAKGTLYVDLIKNYIKIVNNNNKCRFIKDNISRNKLFTLEVSYFFNKIKKRIITDKFNEIAIMTLTKLLEARSSKIISVR